jgi:hypothetical protein
MNDLFMSKLLLEKSIRLNQTSNNNYLMIAIDRSLKQSFFINKI